MSTEDDEICKRHKKSRSKINSQFFLINNYFLILYFLSIDFNTGNNKKYGRNLKIFNKYEKIFNLPNGFISHYCHRCNGWIEEPFHSRQSYELNNLWLY